LEEAWCEEMLPVRGARSEVCVVIGSSRSSRVAVDVLATGNRGSSYKIALRLTIVGINQVVAFHAGVVVVLVGIRGS
jgi:hypothetical protein